MPENNGFRHQTYSSGAPGVPYEVVLPKLPPAMGTDAYWNRLADAGQRLQQAGVSAIYLVHGTFAGTDMSGFFGELRRLRPDWARALGELEKRLIDSLIGDWGNYDDNFEATLAEGINARLERPITVQRYHWSSENHHLSRADGAVRLIARIRNEHFPVAEKKPVRILLWGHSHAGNLFALVTNLLGGSTRDRMKFFRAARSFYRRPNTTRIDLPEWERTRTWLESATGNPMADVLLDMVTFGTPIRYGWETRGYHQLLHIVNHRPASDLPDYRVPFPLGLEQLRSAGDAFQQLFIAGTNFPPNLFAWRSWIAERRLGKLIQAKTGRRGLWERLQDGMRVPNEGPTLLIHYAAADEDDARSLLGHAVYTNVCWLPFHLDAVISRFYADRDQQSIFEDNRVETDSSRHNR